MSELYKLKYNHVNFFRCPGCLDFPRGWSLSGKEIEELNHSGKVVKHCYECRKLYTIEDDGDAYFVK